MRLGARDLSGAVTGLLFGLTLLAAPAVAQGTRVFAPGGIALSGYDAVSYFTESAPVEGSARNALRWHGATWYFATPVTLERFEMNPTAYAPQFGGYCVYWLAEGKAIPGAPDAYIIDHGKLYMMHDAQLLAQVKANLQALIADAEENWPETIDDSPE